MTKVTQHPSSVKIGHHGGYTTESIKHVRIIIGYLQSPKYNKLQCRILFGYLATRYEGIRQSAAKIRKKCSLTVTSRHNLENIDKILDDYFEYHYAEADRIEEAAELPGKEKQIHLPRQALEYIARGTTKHAALTILTACLQLNSKHGYLFRLNQYRMANTYKPIKRIYFTKAIKKLKDDDIIRMVFDRTEQYKSDGKKYGFKFNKRFIQTNVEKGTNTVEKGTPKPVEKGTLPPVEMGTTP